MIFSKHDKETRKTVMPKFSFFKKSQAVSTMRKIVKTYEIGHEKLLAIVEFWKGYSGFGNTSTKF